MSYRLVVRTMTETGHEHAFDLDRDVVLIGRRPGVDVLLPHAGVGGVHARLEREGNRVFVVDAGKPGGTSLRGQKLAAGQRTLLVNGDEMEVAGLFVLRFQAMSPDRAVPTSQKGTSELARAMVRDLLGRGEGAYLEVKDGNRSGARFPLPIPGKDVVIGRDDACDIVIDDEGLSREHARIHRGWLETTIADLGSKNGTFVGRRAIPPGEETPLRPHAKIRLGNILVAYEDEVESYMAELDDKSRRRRRAIIAVAAAVAVAALIALVLLFMS